MDALLDLAASIQSRTFTLFIGTGVSKFLTNGKAPSWLELLALASDKIDAALKPKLFVLETDGTLKDSKLPLLVVAQVLDVECAARSLNLREIVAQIIKDTTVPANVIPTKVKPLRDFFDAHPAVNVVTTNYDTLIQDYLLPKARLFIEGRPIPRVNAEQNIFHIHGSILKPDSIVLSMADYYSFLNTQNYFFMKFHTLLQESSVAILGYSLGDFNLNSIFYRVNATKPDSLRRADAIYVNRSAVDELYKKYYLHTFGIHVQDHTEIDAFFSGLLSQTSVAKDILARVENVVKVLDGTHSYRDEYLNLRQSFHVILLQAATLGVPQKDPKFLALLVKILDQKKSFSRKDYAWEQYEHLADWLIELGSIVPLAGSPIENDFSRLTQYSLDYASKDLYLGKSWASYTVWEKRFHELLPENRKIVIQVIEKHFTKGDRYGISLLAQHGA